MGTRSGPVAWAITGFFGAATSAFGIGLAKGGIRTAVVEVTFGAVIGGATFLALGFLLRSAVSKGPRSIETKPIVSKAKAPGRPLNWFPLLIGIVLLFAGTLALWKIATY